MYVGINVCISRLEKTFKEKTKKKISTIKEIFFDPIIVIRFFKSLCHVKNLGPT